MSNQQSSVENQKWSAAKPGFSFKDWGIRAIQNTAPGWPPTAIDPSKPFKWQTRRVIKGLRNGCYPKLAEDGKWWPYFDTADGTMVLVVDGPLRQPYRVGQLYYAKEALVESVAWYRGTDRGDAFYLADKQPVMVERSVKQGHALAWRWEGDRLDGTDMPAEAARLFYVLRGIRAEQVQDIGRIWDTLAEGVDPEHRRGQGASWQQWRGRFARYFDEINGDGTWEKNPWVWVYEMERIAVGSQPAADSEELKKEGE